MVLENIRRRCKENSITIAALERATKIGNGVIAKWQSGSPRVGTLQKVADYFGCTVDELLKED